MNAKDELIETLEKICWSDNGPRRTVICAKITHEKILSDEPAKHFLLPLCHVDEIWVEWLESLDFEYKSDGFTECLDGTLWLSDGTYIARDMFDVSYWMHYKVPQIPIELINQ